MIAVKDYDKFKSYSQLACCCFEIKIFFVNRKEQRSEIYYHLTFSEMF